MNSRWSTHPIKRDGEIISIRPNVVGDIEIQDTELRLLPAKHFHDGRSVRIGDRVVYAIADVVGSLERRNQIRLARLRSGIAPSRLASRNAAHSHLRVGYVRDPFIGMGMIFNLLAETGKKLSEVVAELTAYTIVKDKYTVDRDRLPGLFAALEQRWPNAKVDRLDGLRLDWEDRWVHVRPSNTAT